MSRRSKQVQKRRVFIANGHGSIRMLDVLPIKLTVDPSYILPSNRPTQNTLFKEVRILPAEKACPALIRELGRIKPGTVKESKNQFLGRVSRQIENMIETNWSSVGNVVFHTTGYDSRILSWSIKKLWDRGKLRGNVIFVCVGPEGPGMRAILHYEGWDDSHIVTFENMDRYYQACARFDMAWQWINGTASSLFNILWVTPDLLYQDGIITRKWKLWTGFPDRVMHNAGHERGNRINRYYDRAYWWYTGLTIPWTANIMHLWFDSELLRIGAESSCRLGFEIKPHLVQFLDEELFQFSNLNRARLPDLTSQMLALAKKQYQDSWYGKQIKATASADLYRVSWWSRWTSASFCEHLVKEGYGLSTR